MFRTAHKVSGLLNEIRTHCLSQLIRDGTSDETSHGTSHGSDAYYTDVICMDVRHGLGRGYERGMGVSFSQGYRE